MVTTRSQSMREPMTVENRELNAKIFNDNKPTPEPKILKTSNDPESAIFDYNGNKHSVILHEAIENIIQKKKGEYGYSGMKLFIYEDVITKAWDHLPQTSKNHHNDAEQLAKKNGWVIERTTFVKGQKEILKHSLTSHNAIKDLEFRVSTQNFIGGERFIKKNLNRYPETGTYNGGVDVSDSWAILSNRCPKFMEEYTKFAVEHNLPRTKTGALSMNLENMGKFAGCQKQEHNGPSDTRILTKVIIKALMMDGPLILRGTNYQQAQERVYPKSSPKTTQKIKLENKYFSESPVFFKIPITEKDEAKAISPGKVRWNPDKKLWCILPGVDLIPFMNRWSRVD
jgi:hypothetical protein